MPKIEVIEKDLSWYYRPEMKERIRMVMRWSGPRMIIYHPIVAIRHLMR